jgi:hypothetical protein
MAPLPPSPGCRRPDLRRGTGWGTETRGDRSPSLTQQLAHRGRDGLVLRKKTTVYVLASLRLRVYRRRRCVPPVMAVRAAVAAEHSDNRGISDPIWLPLLRPTLGRRLS